MLSYFKKPCIHETEMHSFRCLKESIRTQLYLGENASQLRWKKIMTWEFVRYTKYYSFYSCVALGAEIRSVIMRIFSGHSSLDWTARTAIFTFSIPNESESRTKLNLYDEFVSFQKKNKYSVFVKGTLFLIWIWKKTKLRI